MKQIIYKTKLKLDELLDWLYCYIWDPIEEQFRSIKWFFKNVNTFWKDLWEFRSYDYQDCINVFCTGLESLKNGIQANSLEIDESKNKKIVAIEELLYLLCDYSRSSENFDMAYYNYHTKVKKIWDNPDLTKKEKTKVSEQECRDYILLENKKYKAKQDYIFRLLKGPDFENGEEFDGSGITGWWY